MKKLLLSLGVMGTFAIYSLSQQNPPEVAILPIPTGGPSPTPDNSGQTITVPGPTTDQGNNQPAPTAAGNQNLTTGRYKNGEYAGAAADAYYGIIQVKAIISNGQISDVQFLQYPNDRRTSIMINTQAMPMLRSEAIAAQSANVDIISGATDSSQAFVESLGSALAQAK
jgi:uncharacterized protein with FMN-binding domain